MKRHYFGAIKSKASADRRNFVFVFTVKLNIFVGINFQWKTYISSQNITKDYSSK